jgi:hypothetical protein
MLQAIQSRDPEAEVILADCVGQQSGMGAGGTLHVEGRLWVAASGQSNLFELDAANFPAPFRTCAANVLHDLALPPTERLHAMTLAWNCSTGSKALCSRDRTLPAGTLRSNPTL